MASGHSRSQLLLLWRGTDRPPLFSDSDCSVSVLLALLVRSMAGNEIFVGRCCLSDRTTCFFCYLTDVMNVFSSSQLASESGPASHVHGTLVKFNHGYNIDHVHLLNLSVIASRYCYHCNYNEIVNSQAISMYTIYATHIAWHLCPIHGFIYPLKAIL